MIQDMPKDSSTMMLATAVLKDILVNENIDLPMDHDFYNRLERFLQAAYSEGFYKCQQEYVALQFTLPQPSPWHQLVMK